MYIEILYNGNIPDVAISHNHLFISSSLRKCSQQFIMNLKTHAEKYSYYTFLPSLPCFIYMISHL